MTMMSYFRMLDLWAQHHTFVVYLLTVVLSFGVYWWHDRDKRFHYGVTWAGLVATIVFALLPVINLVAVVCILLGEFSSADFWGHTAIKPGRFKDDR